MGTIDFSKPITSTLNKNMKFFILAALLVASVFAEPEAEADPNALYASYGYSGFPYYGYGAGLAYAGAYAPYTYAGYPYAYGYNGYALGATHLIGKRSADAEAEAKPGAWYGAYGYPYAGAYGYPYAGAYSYGAYPYAYGAHFIGKRSADAEAKPEAWYGAYGYGYAPYSYGYAGYPYGYAGYPYAYGYGK